MVKSILDNDFYKLSMGQAVCMLYPREIVRYSFINRNKTPFPKDFAKKLCQELKKLETLRLKKNEKEFLKKKCPHLNPMYIDFLSGYQFDTRELNISCHKGDLQITVEGPWYKTIYWEVPLMATISEFYFRKTRRSIWGSNYRSVVLRDKAVMLDNMGAKFADFGTRRRYSFKNHEDVIKAMKKYAPHTFKGTSNPYFAMKYDLTPIGTTAHEFIMFMGAKYGFTQANKIALEKWVEVYEGDMGIALSDTYTSNIFFRDFGMKYAKLFDGIRQDSGDPIAFAKKAINHYRSLGIDPSTKTIVFSDSLDPYAVKRIHKFCKANHIKDSYGIGTNLTNNVGVKPLNIVVKLTGVLAGAWVPTVKLSDVEGKHTGDPDTVELCLKTLNLKRE